MSVEQINMGKVSFRSESKSIKRTKKIKEVNPVINDKKDKKNLNVEELMNKILNKMDNVSMSSSHNIYGENKIQPVDVDIKREISIGKVDNNAVKSEEIKGKVNTKLDKLKELRKMRNK